MSTRNDGEHGKPARGGRFSARPPDVQTFGRERVAEGSVVPTKPGNSGGGKGPWFQNADETVTDPVIDHASNNTKDDLGTATEAMLQGQARADVSLLLAV